MQHQFKPGDLALVIDSNVPSDIGVAGTVIEIFIDDQPEYEFRGEIHAGGTPDGKPSAFVDLGSSHGGIWIFGFNQLMPLRDDHAPQLEKQKEAEHV